MDEITRGQVNHSAAEIYDEFFVPALFSEWTAPVLDAAQVRPGLRVLDVACGTGVLTLAAAKRVAPGGYAVGLDINEGMLAVARRKSQTIEWKQAPAERLPFASDQFDMVVSQFGLMFFDNRQAAVREMRRVLVPGGQLTVAVWGRLEQTPGYAAASRLLQRLFGNSAADSIRAPYNLGEPELLKTLFADDGLENIEIKTLTGTARFPSLESWMYTDVKGWTLAGMIDDVQFQDLLREAKNELSEFVNADGSVSFAARAHILTASKKPSM